MGRAGDELRPFECEAPAPEQNQATILLPNMNIFRNILKDMNPEEDSFISTLVFVIKILHFALHFLYNFCINPKTVFTEGHFWTKHNLHVTESDKGPESRSKVPTWGQER